MRGNITVIIILVMMLMYVHRRDGGESDETD